jgi:hypothetical protein
MKVIEIRDQFGVDSLKLVELTDGVGADHVVDTVGGLKEAIAAVRLGGTMDDWATDRPLPSVVERIGKRSDVQYLISARLSSKWETLYRQITLLVRTCGMREDTMKRRMRQARSWCDRPEPRSGCSSIDFAV